MDGSAIIFFHSQFPTFGRRTVLIACLQSYELFPNSQRKAEEYLAVPIIFRTFVPVPESTISPIYSPSKTHSIMNKTWKTILQVISYIITLLLGGAAGNAVM